MRTPAPSFQHHRLIHFLSFLIGSCIIVVDALKIMTNRSDLPGKCPPFQCGNGGVLIKYPFSPPMGLLGRNYSNYYCGYQELSVSCIGDKPMFNTSTNSYVVKAIDYTNRSMSLIDADVLNDDCPKVNHPLNISYTNILDISPSDMQLEFFFECTPQEQFVSNLVACLSNKTGKGASYVLPNESDNNGIRSNLRKDCLGGSVTSTVLLEQWNGIDGDISRFGSVLQHGFKLTWKKTINRNCSRCEKSNGSCGYVNETGLLDFKCYCKDGKDESTDCLNSSSNKNADSSSNKKKNIVIALSAVGLGLGFLILAAIFKRRKIIVENFYDCEPIITNDSLLFDPTTIQLATQNFSESNKIGEGGFGSVYKGIIPSMKQEIAVKLLSSSSHQGIEELKNEVSLLVKLKHKNLVQLLGFCVERRNKCLIYEYVNNQSLDKFLSDPVKREQLVWQKRYNIIKGIAKGLLYLHEESHVKIIHRDLKASNILLDSDLNPKIADFGLARIIDLDHTKEITRRIAGTFGYMSPEYVTFGLFSIKSDVFSFGILLLEIIMGRKSSDFYRDENESTNLLSFVWENWRKSAISTIVDSLLGTNYAMDEALTCIQIGLLCVQESPNDRITMATVVRLLYNCHISINAPSRPAFLLDGGNEFSYTLTNVDGVKFDQKELEMR